MENSTLFDFEQDLKQEIFHQFINYGVRLPIKAKLAILDVLDV